MRTPTIKEKLFGRLGWPTTLNQRRYPKPLPTKIDPLAWQVSVVIPTRNRPGPLSRCLDSVFAQTLKPKEIVIVDGGQLNQEDLRKHCEEHDIPLIYARKLNASIAEARNAGAKLASHSILVFTDDDNVLTPSYIEETCRVFASDTNKEVGGVDGQTIEEPAAGVKELLQAGMRFAFGGHLPAFEGEILPTGYHSRVNHGDTPVFSKVFYGTATYRKEVVVQFGLDETNFPGYTLGEDSEFAYRVSQHFKLVNTPFARYWHKHASSGRPDYFKLGIQRMFSVYRPRTMHNDFGLINYPLLFWLLSGVKLLAAFELIKPSSTRQNALRLLTGEVVGTLLLPLAVASRNRLAMALAHWISNPSE